jgi:uncharacterized protein YciI
VLGGPYSDFSGSHVVYEGVDAEEARRIVAADPFLANGVFELEDVRDWTVYVDALSERGKGSDPSTAL